jgi:hypothetical protein
MTDDARTPAADQAPIAPVRPHFYVLLDRSGSMESMRADVIGGFNQLIAEQQADGPDARITLVQFDSQDPQEVLIDARRIVHARPLTHSTFVPRGGTPLLDATGQLITRASVRQQERHVLGKWPEAITFITITDGEENQSREYGRPEIVRLVADKEALGWTFAFLGAGLDAYAEAGAMGYDPRAVQAFAPDGTGARAAFRSVSGAMVARRQKLRTGEAFDPVDFYEGFREAEADRRRRHGQ